MGNITIVVAWLVEGFVHNGKPWAADLGQRPGLRPVMEPRAAVWLNRGTSEDVAKAREYITKAEPETGRVFVYATDERDPLGRARKEILGKKAA